MSHVGKIDEESGGHYAMDYYSVVKRNELQMHMPAWKNHRCRTLGESSQTYRTIFQLCHMACQVSAP